ncbi:MAG: hypothetical protein [Microviridae sp.]|nr:MAG: hypothetical protein [Microviridae sp.]
MAKRIFKAQVRPCKCTLCADIDRLQTKEGLALTPSHVKELTDKGIAVNLPNANGFFSSESKSDWFVEPQFRRDANMASLWEQEQSAKSKVVNAHKKDKQKYG